MRPFLNVEQRAGDLRRAEAHEQVLADRESWNRGSTSASPGRRRGASRCRRRRRARSRRWCAPGRRTSAAVRALPDPSTPMRATTSPGGAEKSTARNAPALLHPCTENFGRRAASSEGERDAAGAAAAAPSVTSWRAKSLRGQCVAAEDDAHAAVAHHRDARAMRDEIGEAMGDEQDDAAGIRELAHLAEQARRTRRRSTRNSARRTGTRGRRGRRRGRFRFAAAWRASTRRARAPRTPPRPIASMMARSLSLGFGQDLVSALPARHHVLGDGEVREQLRLLMHDRDDVPLLARRPRPAVERQASRGRPLLAADHAHQRRLAGAVRPGDAEDLAGRDVEVEPVQRHRAAVALRQVGDADAAAASSLIRPTCASWSGTGRAPPR